MNEGLLPKLYTPALIEAMEAWKLQGSCRNQGRGLLMSPSDLARKLSTVRPPPLLQPSTAAAAAAAAAASAPNWHNQYRSWAASAAVPGALAVYANGGGSLAARGGGGLGGAGGGGAGLFGGGGAPGQRAPQLLPNIQRCGECRTCLNRHLKKACLRNKVRRVFC